jgi:site-specific recombinase XerD
MKLWPKAIQRKMNLHSLRHTTATLLKRAGVDIHIIQRILRHADIKLTADTYGHVNAEDLREAVNKIAPLPQLAAEFAPTGANWVQQISDQEKAP